MEATSQIVLSDRWVTSECFEYSLRNTLSPHDKNVSNVIFQIFSGSRIMVDTGIRLLSLANQLCFLGKNVTLYFQEGEDGALGYLNRIGFFDHLYGEVTVLPTRPVSSGASMYRGKNTKLVEIARINPAFKDKTIPSKLADALEEAVLLRSDHKSLSFAAFTVLSELIDNIFQHSSTELDGYSVSRTMVYPH